jgi:tRNA pseudouridine32 synthase/23S rRNA pseudouridine746 synthase
MELAVIYHDDALLVLSKPSGLPAVPGLGAANADNLASRAQHTWPTATIVHRLDRDTSGVMVMALTPETHRFLSRQFEERAVAKRYVAIVSGHLEELSGIIDAPLRKDMDRPPRHMVDRDLGKPAETHWSVIEREASTFGCQATRLLLEPRTGRSHQLRVHLSHVGHPILGDPLYGTAKTLAAAPRLMLHAEWIELAHPTTGDRQSWTVPCPF